MKIFSTIFFVIIVYCAKAQFTTMFNDTILPFGNGGYALRTVCQDDSFYYVTGVYKGSYTFGKNQFISLKLNKFGNIIQKRILLDSIYSINNYPYNSTIIHNNEIITCAIITDSAYVVSSKIIAFNKHTLDTLWTKTYPHPDTASIMSSADEYSTLTAIKATPDNAYILTGNYMTAGNERSYLLKIDSVGNILWTKTYSDVTKLFCIELTPNDGFAVINRYGGTNFMLLDSNGNEIWRKKVNNYIGNGTSGDLKYVGNNNFVVSTAYMYNTDVNNPLMGINIYKINISNQHVSWDKTYILYQDFIGITLHQAMGLKILPDGSFIVSGTVQKDGGRKGFIFKLNSNGDSLWTKTYDYGTHYNNNDRCQLNDLISTDDGGFFGVGFFWDKTSNDVAWMFKTDANGTIGFENPKFEGSKFNVFPNPATDFVKIEFNSQKSKISSYKIYNSQGKLLLTEKVLANNFTINIKDFASGVYFIEATTSSGESVVEKFVKE